MAASLASSLARPRIAVIGGGVSGLAAAHRLSELAGAAGGAVDIQLFERSSRLGGLIATRRIGEYLVELGADSFITTKPWALDLCRRLGLEARLIGTDPNFRRAFILHRGRPVPAPDGLQLMAPRRLGPFLRTPLLSWRGKLRAAAEWLLPGRPAADDESLAAFVRRRFGAELLERIAQPMVGGIYTSNPETLSVHAALPRFVELERAYGSIIRGLRATSAENDDSSGARYGMFVSLRGGLQELLETLSQRVADRATVNLSVRAAIAEPAVSAATENSQQGPPSGRRWRLSLDGARPAEDFDAVIVALPAHAAAGLVSAWAPELSEALRAIPFASSAIVVSGHRLEDVADPLAGAGLVIPHAEGRRVIAVSYSSRKFPGRAPEGRVILRTFVGGDMQPELLEHSDDDLRRIVAEELRDILGVRGTPDFCEVVRYERAMPQFQVGHASRVATIEARAAACPGLVLCGNSYRGVGIPDAVHDGELAAQRVWGLLENC